MCGRYVLISKKKIHELYNIIIKPSYNIAPNMKVLILNENFNPIFNKWGIETKIRGKIVNVFNTRSENIQKNYLFKECKMCIFLVSGFFEWQKTNTFSIPYFIYLSKRIMFLAGIYNEHGCSIVTKKSHENISAIHHRQPVILKNLEFSSWFNNTYDFTSKITKQLKYHRVSKRVNFIRNNDLNNIKPLCKI